MAPVTPAAPLSIADRLRSSDSALSVSELSKLLNVAPLTLLRWVKAKRVPFFRLGRTIRFCPAQSAAGSKHARLCPRGFVRKQPHSQLNTASIFACASLPSAGRRYRNVEAVSVWPSHSMAVRRSALRTTFVAKEARNL
jgi:excisionase family DNA binding protein